MLWLQKDQRIKRFREKVEEIFIFLCLLDMGDKIVPLRHRAYLRLFPPHPPIEAKRPEERSGDKV
jgi:hypothetical protein